jgi:hypothetical protein
LSVARLDNWGPCRTGRSCGVNERSFRKPAPVGRLVSKSIGMGAATSTVQLQAGSCWGAARPPGERKYPQADQIYQRHKRAVRVVEFAHNGFGCGRCSNAIYASQKHDKNGRRRYKPLNCACNSARSQIFASQCLRSQNGHAAGLTNVFATKSKPSKPKPRHGLRSPSAHSYSPITLADTCQCRMSDSRMNRPARSGLAIEPRVTGYPFDAPGF